MKIILPIGTGTEKVAVCSFITKCLSISETQSLLQQIFCEKTSKATGETDEESDANI